MTLPRKPPFLLVTRWLRFSAVGAMGISVQLLAVYTFGFIWSISSFWATALAVEAAVLHNFFWHEHFTWAERHAAACGRILRRLLAFNATTGAVSIVGNLLCVSVLMRQVHAPLLAANPLAVAACSLINFIVNEKLVFRRTRKSTLLASHQTDFTVLLRGRMPTR